MISDYPEDVQYFTGLLCRPGERIDRYSRLFDMRTPAAKRREFNGRRGKILKRLKELYGTSCMLQFASDCEGNRGSLTVDHVIPLSSNKLNKELRQMAALPGKKVATQSIGSNHIANLVLACGPCNGAKKHRFLGSSKTRRLIAPTSRRLKETE